MAEREIVLRAGKREAIVSPHGASLRGYYQRLPSGSVREIVTRYDGADRPSPGTAARSTADAPFQVGEKLGGQGDVLIPFPGRVAGGAYTFDGHSYQLERNDHEGPNAIHGFLRSREWKCAEQEADRARFVTSIDAAEFGPNGYPFSLGVEVGYRVGETGLECWFEIVNQGDRPAPVAAGFHPYFTVGPGPIDEDELQVPFGTVLEFENLVPTGRVLSVNGTSLDFRKPARIGPTRINNCYLDPVRDADGLLRVRLRRPATGQEVTVWMDQAFSYVVLYSGDPLPPEHRRRSLAIEPMTCGSDAFNHPQWGLAALQPGEALRGRWGVTDA